MISFDTTKSEIENAINSKNMLLIIGNCFVKYWGRAASKLPTGKRLILIKGDKSIAIHQNKHLRPTNYMMNATISSNIVKHGIEINASKKNPKEIIQILFYNIENVISIPMEDTEDIRLFGSEKELSNQLMHDLDFIEPGLKPLKQESWLRKGVIDILAEDSRGRLVVVEVKRRKADYNSVTQLQRYMKEVQKIKNKETRGILVAPEIRKTALELLERYGLEYYKFDFEIGNPKATIKGLQSKQTKIV